MKEAYGPYVVTEKLGAGGMGRVVKAYLNRFAEPSFRQLMTADNLPFALREYRFRLLEFDLEKEILTEDDRQAIRSKLDAKANQLDLMEEEQRQQDYLNGKLIMRWAEREGILSPNDVYSSPSIWRALKILDIMGFADTRAENLEERFLQEAETKLNHENIVTVYDSARYQMAHVIVEEYLESANLESARLKEGNITVEYRGQRINLPIQKAVHIIKCVLGGLNYAHNNDQRSVVHRDIKPGNILWNPDEDIVKICDFGLIKPTKKEDDPQITKSGDIPGSPAYIAPEQALKLPLSPRVDVYGAGASLCKLLTGNPPVTATTAYIAAARLIRGDAVWPAEENPNVTEELSDLVRKTCMLEPEYRVTVKEALFELETLEQQGRLETTASETGRRLHEIDTTLLQKFQQIEEFGRRKKERGEEKRKEETSTVTRFWHKIKNRKSIDDQLEREESELFFGCELENAELFEQIAEMQGRASTASAKLRFEYLHEAFGFYQKWIEKTARGQESTLRRTEIDLRFADDIRPDPEIDYGTYGPYSITPAQALDRCTRIKKNMALEIARIKHIMGTDRTREQAEEIKELEAILKKCKEKH